jgi:hypothetical protein
MDLMKDEDYSTQGGASVSNNTALKKSHINFSESALDNNNRRESNDSGISALSKASMLSSNVNMIKSGNKMNGFTRYNMQQ